MHHIESDPPAARSQPVKCGGRRVAPAAIVLVLALSTAIPAGSPRSVLQVPSKEALPGIVNYTRAS